MVKEKTGIKDKVGVKISDRNGNIIKMFSISDINVENIPDEKTVIDDNDEELEWYEKILQGEDVK